MRRESRYRYEFLCRPARFLSEAASSDLVRELREVAATCFSEVPEYQCLEGKRESLEDKVIVVARNREGQVAGFCSAVLLPVPGVGDVLHLGLTCVRPGERSHGLTHRLTSRLVTAYLLKHSPFKRVWVTNLACVLSSLGNVALHFEKVFPSPFGKMVPDREQALIAKEVNDRFRDKLYVRADAEFDERFFVFRGSVKGTVFQKDAHDARFRHRSIRMNKFYSGLLSFEEGDEVLQVGHVSLLTGVKYSAGRFLKLPFLNTRQRWAWESGF